MDRLNTITYTNVAFLSYTLLNPVSGEPFACLSD